MRAALLRSAGRQVPASLESSDLRRKLCQRQQQALIVFVVDASESMAAGAQLRLQATRGAILALLTNAYQRRDQVALIAFRGDRAEVLLAPTVSVELARTRLRRLPIGGATPFADGLRLAQQVIESSQRRQPALVPTLVIVSDGEANVPLTSGGDVHEELFLMARQLTGMSLQTVIVDTSSAVGGSRILHRLADQLGGVCHRARDLQADQLYAIVRRSETQTDLKSPAPGAAW